jgi:hypothetical protein
MSEPAKEAPKYKLQAVYFPTINVSANAPGYPSMISMWSIDKYPLIRCDERSNGDVWLTHPSGQRTEISALVIAYRVRVPEKAQR